MTQRVGIAGRARYVQDVLRYVKTINTREFYVLFDYMQGVMFSAVDEAFKNWSLVLFSPSLQYKRLRRHFHLPISSQDRRENNRSVNHSLTVPPWKKERKTSRNIAALICTRVSSNLSTCDASFAIARQQRVTRITSKSSSLSLSPELGSICKPCIVIILDFPVETDTIPT